MSVAAKAGKARGLRQTMSDLHTWTGLLVGWILYAMFLTGTASYFKEEISRWARPELAVAAALPDEALAARRLVDALTALAPGSPEWSFEMPSARNPVASSYWREPAASGKRGYGSAELDPATGRRVSARETAGGEFFYRFHFQFRYMPVMWGRWLAGFCAMFMLVAIVSGIITHKKIFTDFFTFRWGKGQRSWLDAHNVLAVFGLPFHLMITYTGLVMLMTQYMPWGAQLAYPTPAAQQQFWSEFSAYRSAEPASGRPAPLARIEDMVAQAQARWGAGHVGRVSVTNAGDAAARVSISRAEDGRVSSSPQFLRFDGATGRLLEARDASAAATETRGVMYALHMGRFGASPTRWLYFLVGLGGSAMIATGLVLWTVKRRTRLADPARPHFGFRCVERLNIAAIAGLSIAMTAFLWGNRLLPVELAGRADWEVHVFFIAWASSLAHATVRPAAKAWREQLWFAAAALATLPLIDASTGGYSMLASLERGDWVFAGMDLACLALAGLHVMLARGHARHAARAPHAKRTAPARRPASGSASAQGQA